MQINPQTIVEISKLIGAVGIIAGVLTAFFRWLSKQEKQSADIDRLREIHDEDLKSVQEELCVLNYAVLASLDALMQKGYGGNVGEAHIKLQKHINNKAHRQKGE